MTSRGSRRTGFPRARVTGAWLAALTLLALASAAALAGDPGNVLYQWTDEHGNVRYTPDPDRIPVGRRGTQVKLEPGMPAASAPARPPAPPPAASTTAAPSQTPSVVVPPIERPTPAPAPVAQPSPDAAPMATTTPPAPPAPIAPPAPPAAPAASSAAPEPASPSSPPPAPLAAPNATPPSDASPAPAAAPLSPADAAQRERQLAAAIAADQETLKAMLAATPAPGEQALADSPQLREIAHRLPALQAELAALREQRQPPAGP